MFWRDRWIILPHPGRANRLRTLCFAPGGNSINTAIALARLGVSVRVAAAVGNDRFGQFIRDRVRAEGIDDAGLVTLPGAKTSTSIVLVEASGERRFLHLRGVSAFFSGAESRLGSRWRGLGFSTTPAPLPFPPSMKRHSSPHSSELASWGA